MELKRFAAHEDFVRASAGFIKQAAKGAQPAYVGLSGGQTPLPVYAALAQSQDFDPEQAEFFLIDERYVPRDHPDSNYAAIVKSFAAAEPFFSDHFHFFDTSRGVDEAVAAYAKELDRVPGGQFDLILLGIGSDGHTASLFPGDLANDETERTVAHVVNKNAPHPPVRDRLTITWPVILNAKQILVLVTGQGKETLVEELLRGQKNYLDFPPRKLAKHPAVTVHFLA